MMTNTDIEYLGKLIEIAFPPLHICPECDGDFNGQYGYFSADNTGHITMRSIDGEWAIVIACEGYHTMRDLLA